MENYTKNRMPATFSVCDFTFFKEKKKKNKQNNCKCSANTYFAN